MLTNEQVTRFHEDGFLIVPGVFTEPEVERMRAEVARLTEVESDAVLKNASTVNIYRAHEAEGPTGSAVFSRVARLRRLLDPVGQLIGPEPFYIYNSHIFGKEPFTGAAMMWHQDYGYWRLEGMPEPKAVKLMISLGRIDPLAGCVWFIPGSHKRGWLRHVTDPSAQFKHWSVRHEEIRNLMDSHPAPVPIDVGPGDVAFFHGAAVHSSGFNLSARERWQCYVAYNPVANHPTRHVRPDRFCSHDYTPVEPVPDDALAGV
jgi:ectoine hydroxylase